jgi:hypothetical protein
MDFFNGLIPKLSLCITCKRNGDVEREAFCVLNRMDQKGKGDFKYEACGRKRVG